MDEQLRQRLNRKLLEINLSRNVNTTNTNTPNVNNTITNEVIDDEVINNEIYNDYLAAQDELIPRQSNFSVLQEVVTDTNKLALVFLFGISLYALYVLSKNKKQ